MLWTFQVDLNEVIVWKRWEKIFAASTLELNETLEERRDPAFSYFPKNSLHRHLQSPLYSWKLWKGLRCMGRYGVITRLRIFFLRHALSLHVCHRSVLLFLLKLKWPKNKSVWDCLRFWIFSVNQGTIWYLEVNIAFVGYFHAFSI